MDYAWTFIVFKQGYGFPATESVPDDLFLAFSHIQYPVWERLGMPRN